MKKAGFTWLFIDVVLTTYLTLFTRIEVARISIISLLFLFIGLIFAFYERITGLKYKGLEIQTVTEKAIKDAQEIEKILDEVRIQKQTLDLILRDLDQTHSRITGIETQVLNKGKDIEKLSMDVEEQIEHLERRIKDVDTGVFAKILALR